MEVRPNGQAEEMVECQIGVCVVQRQGQPYAVDPVNYVKSRIPKLAFATAHNYCTWSIVNVFRDERLHCTVSHYHCKYKKITD